MKKIVPLLGAVVMAALIGVVMLACDTGTSPSRGPGLPRLASHTHGTFVNGVCTYPRVLYDSNAATARRNAYKRGTYDNGERL